MRERRARGVESYADLSDEQRERAVARSIAGVYERRGALVSPGCCAVCGSIENVERHHPDYSRPLDVEWLCRRCHNSWHRLHDVNRETLARADP